MFKNSTHQKGNVNGILVVILVLVLLAGLGYVFWQNFMSKENSTKKTETVQQPQTKEVDHYAGWQNYSNPVAGYTLKFPSDWKNETNTDVPTLASSVVGFMPSNSDSVVVTVSSYKSDRSPKDFVKSNGSAPVLDSNGDSINNNPTYYEKTGDASYTNRSYTIAHQGTIVTISMTEMSKTIPTDNAKYVDQFDLLAKSVKF